MNYQRFATEQTSLTRISLAYKHDPEFRKQLDADPKSIFIAELAELDGEVVIMHNSNDDFYFILPADINGAMCDNETRDITAAALHSLGQERTEGGALLVFRDTDSGRFFRQFKTLADPYGLKNLQEVTKTGPDDDPTFIDVLGSYINKSNYPG